MEDYAMNKESKSKTISFRAKPVLHHRSDVPPMSGWKSTSGKEKSFKVIERSSLVYTLEQAEASGGSVSQDQAMTRTAVELRVGFGSGLTKKLGYRVWVRVLCILWS